MDNNWSCVLLIGLCLRFVEGKMVHHHHQPYHSKPLVHGNDIRLLTFADGEYKPAAGEILAKDSILYSQKPETRLLRRQLWPIMQETMDTLVDSVTAGANLFKNMLVTNPNPIATKIRNIKNAYISSATVPHKKFARPQTMKKVPKTKKYPSESHRTKTVSEDYVHTYRDEAYTVPTYVVKSASKNPYSQMGLKDYKHFEETVLRELEEKEEKRVEATMASFYNKNTKNMGDELIEGSPLGGWKPVIPSNHVNFDDSYHVDNKPKEVGKLHTNFVSSGHKPIHEAVDESRPVSEVLETIIEQPVTNDAAKTRRRKLNSKRSTTTTVSPPRPFTRKTTKEESNYPEYFLNKQTDANQNSQAVSQELNYINRMKFYREHMQASGLTTSATFTSTTNRPPTARDALLLDASEEKFVFITPLPKLANDKKVQRVNRQKAKTMMSTDGQNSEKASNGNRGSIKFSDSI